jgi:hypothetical protein
VYSCSEKKKSGQVSTCRIGPFPCECETEAGKIMSLVLEQTNLKHAPMGYESISWQNNYESIPGQMDYVSIIT